MSTRALRYVSPAALVAAAALTAVSVDAGDPLPLPEGFVEIAEPASGVAEIVETEPGVSGEDQVRGRARSTTGGPVKAAAQTEEGPAAATAVPDAESRPASRLLRSLEEWVGPATGASPSPTPDPASAGGGQTTAGAPIGEVPGSSPVPGRSPVLHGCPRALLASLLAEATETADAVSALAIERETLALCRERQEIVNGIVALEGELRELLTEAQNETGTLGTIASPTGSADLSIVKVSAPVRVIEMPAPAPVPAETEETDTPPAPQPPVYSWFSIVGTAGDLRAGISGSAGNGGTSAWFVREGDRLPGGVTVTRIVARPPGVHVGGAIEAALPYRPRPVDAGGPRGNTPSGGHTAVDGDGAGAER